MDLNKVATLGGKLHLNKESSWMYFGEGNATKERLFGFGGPLHFGMPHKEAIAIGATESDTKKDLIRELVEQSGLTKEAAEDTVNRLVSRGVLVEVNDPDLGKVLIFRGGLQ